jgi:hypothetical protein
MTLASILWTRLDTPGHDACRLEETRDGWRIDGTAVFLHDGAAARLAYRVSCDRSWGTASGEVRGSIGRAAIELVVTRTKKGAWLLNGDLVLPPDDYADLDIGATPATNLLQIRRMGLRVGQQADCPVAWLDVNAGTLEVVEQTYERRSEVGYWYEAPRFGYAAMLEVSEIGFVREYPRLWRAEV